ncbi:hypothetical protein ANCCAN_06936 [Ancylostoma caninum]|uniref:Uncharacterized protein n=1 Tax=Ancylostoma caninum TaxID=29170 RepID=A0A368GVJ1_ANCCA|nr:hypothetical protein ANCCAN_06936 [Ancylostoma caninum]
MTTFTYRKGVVVQQICASRRRPEFCALAKSHSSLSETKFTHLASTGVVTREVDKISSILMVLMVAKKLRSLHQLYFSYTIAPVTLLGCS